MKTFRYIGIMIMVLLAAVAEAQVPVLDSVCSGTVRNYRVTGDAGSTYSWILSPPTGAQFTLPSDADTIQIPWTYPSGTYILKTVQHALNGCDADTVYGQVFIFDQPLVDAGPDDYACIGRTYKPMGADSSSCSSVLWTTSGDGHWDDSTLLIPIYIPGINDELNGGVTLTITGWGLILSDGGCAPSVSSMELDLVYEIIPTFDSINPICQFSIPQALPDTSLEGITGDWIPPVINTDFLGTLPYRFVPNDPNDCGIETDIFITITTEINPNFGQLGPYCIFSTPPALPDTSLEGITGTWEPPVIATDVAGVFMYIFYPDDSTQCGLVDTNYIAVVTEILPVFEPIGPFCQNDVPPALPDTSVNGIAGTWNPPTIDTSIPGTFPYEFTADPDACGLDTTIMITINPLVMPEFAIDDTLCQYAAAPILPNVSLNGITGIWIPAWISTNNPGTFAFMFIPDDLSQCGLVYTMEVTVVEEIVPQFDPIGPLCLNSPPPALPDTSNNGVFGTWVPPVITTDQVGTFFFTFTPDTSFACALDTTIVINVVTDIVPTFEQIGPLCQNTPAPALPDTSLENISGTWAPPVIDTSIPGTFTFTFTPDTGQCAIEAFMDIVITDEMTPEFDPIPTQCQGLIPPDLPVADNNGMTGTWNPPAIDTSVPGTFEFIFTPDPGQCGVPDTMYVTISDQILPTFEQLGPFCQYIVPPLLPDTSLGGMHGTWDPPIINTQDPGTITYTFIPDPDQCGVNATMDITIVISMEPDFAPIGPLCQNSAPVTLPVVSLNNITGTWNPPIINTQYPGTNTYTFTPDATSCGIEVIMNVEILGLPQITNVQFNPTHCSQADGEINITATSPSGAPLEYSIDGGLSWMSFSLFTGLPTGTYNIMVRDNMGCEVAYSGNPVTITDQPGPVVSQTIVTDETDGLHNGSILIIASGSTPQLFYSINGGATWQINNGLFENLVHGIYICVVKDENDCDTTFIIEVENVILTELEAITKPGRHCLGDAAIVPIDVDKFFNVAEFRMTLSYNVDLVTCQGYDNAHPQLADQLGGYIDQAAGNIVITWQSPTPVTFTTMTLAFNLVFTPKEAGQGQITWYTDPVDSYFHDPEGNSIPALYYSNDITIYQPPEILLDNSVTVCDGDSLTIYGSTISYSPPMTYEWTYPDGSVHYADPHFSSITYDDAGYYSLLATDNMGCYDQKTINVIVSPNPVAAFHGTDTLAVAPGYILEAGYGLLEYLWNTGSTEESITIDTTGWYWVDMTSRVGCKGLDSIFMYIDEDLIRECLYIPNAFTPNADNLNDVFKVYSKCPLTYFRMEIFNRWGEFLWSTEDINEGWDGKKHGNTLPGDAYVYKIAYRTSEAMADEVPMTVAGVVLKLR